MTRVRVLLAAKKLLLDGVYLPMSVSGCATNRLGAVCSYMHPDAKNFTIIGAIQRSIFNLTGDDFRERDRLFDESLDPLVKRAGGIGAFRTLFTTAPVEKALEFIIDQLSEWDR